MNVPKKKKKTFVKLFSLMVPNQFFDARQYWI